MQVYKEPLLCDISDNGPLLNAKQVWDIFGDITGILEVHTEIKVTKYVIIIAEFKCTKYMYVTCDNN